MPADALSAALAEADSLPDAEAEADSDSDPELEEAAVAVAVAVAVGDAVGLGVAVDPGGGVGAAVGFGVDVGVGVGVGVGVANADGSVRLVTTYIGEKSKVPDESVPLIVHSPTVDGPKEVSSTDKAATLPMKAATAFALSHPTLCIAVFHV